jgi:S1-C subfamily serine protease
VKNSTSQLKNEKRIRNETYGNEGARMLRVRIGQAMALWTRRSNSKKGLVVSTSIVVATVVVIGLLIGLVLVSNSNTFGDGGITTTTKTQVNVTITTVGSGGDILNGSYSAIDPEQIYSSANQSIVILQGSQAVSTLFGGTQYESILGSGFVVSYSGSYYVITNYHVAGATSNLTVTFSDGNAYAAKVVGADPYSDLAVVSVSNAPNSEYHPIQLASSSSVRIGQYVVAIGNPYGLSDSITLGIVSQLGETIEDPTAGNYSIADAIQFSAPINPGNSGGVLLNANASVIGITTAEVSGSQGVGFAIPSDTIIKELPSLVASGSYDLHPYLGIYGADMNYQLSQAEGTNVTYGVLIETVVQGGPASNAGLKGGSSTVAIDGAQYLIGGDIIVSVNGTKIISNNALATYLEIHTIAGQTVSIGIIRSGAPMTVQLTLGARPPI